MIEDRYVVVNGKGESDGKEFSLAAARGECVYRNKVYAGGPFCVMRVTLTPVDDEAVGGPPPIYWVWECGPEMFAPGSGAA